MGKIRLLLGVCVAALLMSGSAADAARPAGFRVGAAVRSIDPQGDVYAGGFGVGPPIHRVLGALQVRAMYISNGRAAVAFAVVDAQAYFAAYQEGPGYGISSAREQAAAAISRTGPRVAAADIIVQGTHSHAAPTLEGIWGPTPPAYLRQVHDATVAALAAAARNARSATLQYGAADGGALNNGDNAQYDSFPGWTLDPQVSVLRAVTRSDRRTIATLVNVPAHPDIVCGACLKTLNADYPGAVRETLDRTLGGITLVTPATLGRQESPVQATGVGEMRWFARIVASLAAQALARPHVVTDRRLSGTERMISIPGGNPALLALVAANHLPDSGKQALLATSGQYPIDRADTPPYLTGNTIGTPLTALRIGSLAYLSMPGEPFPEIRLDLLAAVHGVSMLVGLAKGQDDLGYFYPAYVYPFTEVYPTDQGTFSVAPQAGDQIMQGQLANLGALGFPTDALAVPAPLPTDYGAAARPAVQALASPPQGDAGPAGRLRVTLQAIYAPAEQNGEPLAGRVHWNFGDGTGADTPALSFGGPCGSPTLNNTGATNCPRTGPAYVAHGFRPGQWRVRVSGRDTGGNAVAYTLVVRVFRRARPGFRVVGHRGRVFTLAAVQRGGSGHILAARWSFPGGSTARGLVVRHRFARGRRPSARVRIVDSASAAG